MNVRDLEGKTIAFLASGGLDSCTLTRWLADKGVRVVTFTADLGQPDEPDLEAVAQRMRDCGAVEAVIVPLRNQMAETGLLGIHALAKYEGDYWITTPHGRRVTVKGVLPLLRERNIDVLSHGATGRGNDQVRFTLISNMLAPDIAVYAPWRDSECLEAFGGREEMLAFCAEHNLPIKPPSESKYSTDANLLGLTHEAGELESLSTAAHFVTPGMGVRPTEAPDKPERITVRYEKGRPVSINGDEPAELYQIFEKANEIGGRNAVAINDHLVENRFIGIKSRGIYEAPGMEVLGRAYEYLLQAILDRRARNFFEYCSHYIAEQLYEAHIEDLGTVLAEGATQRLSQLITGTVTLELYKGTVSFVELKDAPHSIYIEENSSMSNVEGFDHQDSEGFLGVLGVGARATALKNQIPGL